MDSDSSRLRRTKKLCKLKLHEMAAPSTDAPFESTSHKNAAPVAAVDPAEVARTDADHPPVDAGLTDPSSNGPADAAPDPPVAVAVAVAG